MQIAGLTVGWEWLIGGVPLVALLYWWYQERQETDGADETIDRVGERARVMTGNLFSATTSLVGAVLLIALTVGSELLAFADDLVMVAGADPTLAGMLSTGLLGVLGISGFWDVSPWTFGVVVLTFTVIVAVWRRREPDTSEVSG